MKIVLILALIAVASAGLYGCAYFQNEQACFSSTYFTKVSFCKTYSAPTVCSECFPGYTKNTAGTVCVADTAFLNWTKWPTTSDAHVTDQPDSQNCLNFNVQFSKAIDLNYDGATAYTWNYAQMSCTINGQQVCQTCKPGFRWDTTSSKCAACPGNCTTCSLVGSTNTCSVCSAGYFLATPNCTACDAGILTCSTAAVAITCKPGYFKDGTKCTACEGTTTSVTPALTCTSATVSTVCNFGYYMDTTPKCTICPQTDVGTCNGTGNAGILSCKNSADVNTYYKHSSEGCVSHASSNLCKTLYKSGATVYCDSCFDGYVRNSGVCVDPATICLLTADTTSTNVNIKTTYADACVAITNQTAATAITLTSASCKSGYYLENRTSLSATAKCRKCTNTDTNCLGACVQNATNTLAATCTAATAVGAYYVATAGSVALSCATKYGTGCATCSDVGCLTVSDTTLYARCKRKVVATGGYATDFSKLGSCLLTSPSVASGDEYTALDGTTMLTSAMLVSNCAEYEWVASTETMKYTAAQLYCKRCTRTSVANVAVTEVAVGGLIRAAVIQTCTQGELSAGAHPVKADKYKHCIRATYETGGSGASTATICHECDLELSLPAATLPSASGCTALAAPLTNCLIHTSITICLTCKDGFKKSATGTQCKANQTNCTTQAALADADTATKCETCATGFTKKVADGTCLSCSSPDVRSGCAEFATNTADTACWCSKCNAGYYIDTDGKCSVSVDGKYCYYLDPTITQTYACAICRYGYKLVNKVCTACTTTSPCVNTGCDGQAYIKKVTTPPNTTTSYSSIISFIIMSLVALLTFII